LRGVACAVRRTEAIVFDVAVRALTVGSGA